MSYQFANSKDLDTLYEALPQTLKDYGFVGGDKPKPDDINCIGRLAQEAYAEGVDAGLKIVTEGAEGSETTGYRLNGVSTTGKGQIGEGAVDLSKTISIGSSFGATGIASHAEGGDSLASGDYSHSEGFNSQATGIGSHSEGVNTIAAGPYSHAEGGSTIAGDQFSHAEGSNCRALVFASHSEGLGTLIPATAPQGAHAEGSYCISDNWEDKISVVGIGSSNSNRKDGRRIYTNGTMELPEAQIRDTYLLGDKAVPTTEWVKTHKTPTAVWTSSPVEIAQDASITFLSHIIGLPNTPCKIKLTKMGYSLDNGELLTIGVRVAGFNGIPAEEFTARETVATGVVLGFRDLDHTFSGLYSDFQRIQVTLSALSPASDASRRTPAQGSSIWVEYTLVEAE